MQALRKPSKAAKQAERVFSLIAGQPNADPVGKTERQATSEGIAHGADISIKGRVKPKAVPNLSSRDLRELKRRQTVSSIWRLPKLIMMYP